MLVFTLILTVLAVVSGLPVTQYDMNPGTVMTGSDDPFPSLWKVTPQLLTSWSDSVLRQQPKRVREITQEMMPFEQPAPKRVPSLVKTGNLLTIWKRLIVDCQRQPWLNVEKPSDGLDIDNFRSLQSIFKNCFKNKDGIRF